MPPSSAGDNSPENWRSRWLDGREKNGENVGKRKRKDFTKAKVKKTFLTFQTSFILVFSVFSVFRL